MPSFLLHRLLLMRLPPSDYISSLRHLKYNRLPAKGNMTAPLRRGAIGEKFILRTNQGEDGPLKQYGHS